MKMDTMAELTLTHIILLYFAVINVATFLTYGLDKWKAKRSKWRITEAALLMLAVLGGSIGAWLGMKVWHHKTLHKKFRMFFLAGGLSHVFLSSQKSFNKYIGAFSHTTFEKKCPYLE